VHTIELVRLFHLAFAHPVRTVPTTPKPLERLLRFRLLFEEVMEFGRAIGVSGLSEQTQEAFEADVKRTMAEFSINEDAVVSLSEAADALGDIDYVTAGANLVFGFPAEAVVAEIHRANMSKLGADGRPVHDGYGKVVKGPNYKKPNVAQVLLDACSPDEDEQSRIWGPR
jgi:predicted HAD superfamily Cof-like phosphohydrolase